MSFNYIDIHSHVNFAAFKDDTDEVISRALTNGVAVINVGTQRDTSLRAVELAQKYDKGVYAIIGVHPIHTGKSFHDEKELGEGNKEFTSRGEIFDFDFYKKLASDPKVVGIGECGLDYYRAEEENELAQKKVFGEHIALANEVRKPLMLHVRSGARKSAYREALAMLKQDAKVSGNFHFFAGSWDEAREILDAGFNLSFTGVITFARSYDEVIKNTPLDRIMSETDSPYVAPEPYRGKRNEPLYVREVVKAIARIKNLDEQTVAEHLIRNAETFFKIALKQEAVNEQSTPRHSS